MPEYTLKVRRYQPETGEGPYWQEFKVDLDPDLSVLDGLLQVRDRRTGRSSSAAPAGRRSAARAG